MGDDDQSQAAASGQPPQPDLKPQPVLKPQLGAARGPDQGLALGDRRGAAAPGAPAEPSPAPDQQPSQRSGLTWRQVIGLVGIVAGLLIMIVYLIDPQQSWSVVQKPLIAVAMGLGAWLFCVDVRARWIWLVGSASLLTSAGMLLSATPWLGAVGLALLGGGSGAWCAWGYRGKRRSGWFSTFLSLTAYLVFVVASMIAAKHGNPWYLLGFGLFSCAIGGLFVRQTLAKPLKPPLWWRIRRLSGRILLLTGILAPYATFILQKVL